MFIRLASDRIIRSAEFAKFFSILKIYATIALFCFDDITFGYSTKRTFDLFGLSLHACDDFGVGFISAQIATTHTLSKYAFKKLLPRRCGTDLLSSKEWFK